MFVYKVEVGEEGRVIQFPLPGGVVRQVVPCPGMVGYCYCCTVILEGECVSMEGGYRNFGVRGGQTVSPPFGGSVVVSILCVS